VSRYVVLLRTEVSREVEVEADSPEAAVAVATIRHGCETRVIHLRPTSVEVSVEEKPEGAMWAVLGKCESCAKPLLFDEVPGKEPPRFVEDGGDGVRICLACAAQFEADHLVNGGDS
jgi:hypothetical protein